MATASVPNASGSAGYVWEDPGDSIMIQLSLDVVDRLADAVQNSLGAGGRGTEIGGILLGRRLPGFVRAVQIDGFELTPCEHLRGASYTLSPKDRRSLGARLARRNPQQVVGFFRSHTRPGMYLDQEDFSVLSQYFSDPSQVCLLIRPAMHGPGMGGFFFWEDNDINRRATYREFPFDSEMLVSGGFPISGEREVSKPVPIRSTPVPAHATPIPVRAAQFPAQADRTQQPVRERRLPSLPWVVVPLIAVLFLIAGLFVSENQPAAPAKVAQKSASTEPAVLPLLPEPVPEADRAPIPAPPVATSPAPTVPETPAETHAVPVQQPPQAAAPTVKAKAANKAANKKKTAAPVVLPAAPVTRAAAPKELEAPPALAANARLDSQPTDVFRTRTQAAPQPGIEVSYEAPQPGVFKRAIRKLEGPDPEAFSAPVPTRKVLPARASDLADAKPVDVKVYIDEAGHVTRAQLLTKGSPLGVPALAAAREWQFKPARKHNKPASGEMILHFR